MFTTPAAQSWLASTQNARVLNAFGRACNLVNEHSEVLALITQELPLTPFALRVPLAGARPFEFVTAETRVVVEKETLGIGELEIDVRDARLWNPQPDWHAIRVALAQPPARLAQLAHIAQNLGKSGSLLDELARPTLAMTQLIEGLHTRNTPLALEGAQTLAGRGSGLTPAGDDFIVGALLAVWAGLLPLPPLSLWERGSGGEGNILTLIVSTAAPRTTTLSGAYLHAAARGECTEQWHNLFNAIIHHKDLRLELEALLAIGHTSGADALAGFIANSLIFQSSH